MNNLNSFGLCTNLNSQCHSINKQSLFCNNCSMFFCPSNEEKLLHRDDFEKIKEALKSIKEKDLNND
jgi:hypothetical protein